MLQEESCEQLGCDVQTVEAEIHIPFPVPGDFPDGVVLDNNPQPEPAPLPISDPAAQLFQDSGFDTASAGWIAFALLIVFLLGMCFADKKAKRKARKKEAEKIEEGTPPLPDVSA